MGRPKAGVEIGGRTLVEHGVEVMLQGGCREVLVVLGADADPIGAQLAASADGWGDRVATVECVQWESGLSASLRTGLASLAARGRGCPVAALTHLVDLPDVGPSVIERILDRASDQQPWSKAIVRAVYNGREGHPALIGLHHWQGVMDSAQGDRGAGRYLREHGAVPVECGDLAAGVDLDTPEDLAAYLTVDRRGTGGPPS